MDYDDLLKIGPYALGEADKDRIYGELLSRLTDRHRAHCKLYDRVCGFLGDHTNTTRSVEEIPMTPVSLFKQADLCSVPPEEVFKTMTSSGTSGQKTSKIFLDRQTAAWQQLTLERIVRDFIGERRIPMLIVDSPDVLRDRNLFSARGAGILGFSIFGTKRCYALTADMALDYNAVQKFLEEAADGPVLVFGFTYIIWKHFYQALAALGKTLPLENGFLIHGGGWKKLQSEAVSQEVFKKGLENVCGISRVRNYYGMAEQTGCIYMECECGNLHVSSYSDVRIRNMEDFSCCKNGTEGVIQVLTPMAWSYPGHSILTEDKGIILGVDNCPCGRKGKYIKITGRIPKAEVRGCSDTYEG
ncbi:MAG: acyl-protein synthetase [Lachnospiraceae bacterium]|nr:acyl-protein synthetase [Lachnospiraceae bacterium]